MSGHKGQLGVSAGVERSPAAKARRAKARKRQEARWAARSGPVTVRFDPSIVRNHDPQ